MAQFSVMGTTLSMRDHRLGHNADFSLNFDGQPIVFIEKFVLSTVLVDNPVEEPMNRPAKSAWYCAILRLGESLTNL
ncbi:MAG: hypothetical protein JSR65_01010 [Proteobacteria bacterium]|nr:hypothetical protein [Pseudomonadota bacterium]